MIDLRDWRLFENLTTSLRRFSSRFTTERFAISYALLLSVLSKWKIESTQQRQCLFIRSCRCCNRDVQSPYCINSIIINFRKHYLLPYPQIEISPTIETPLAESPEITYPRYRYVYESIQKLVHAILPQRYLAANRPTFPYLECCDRPSCECNHRFLPGYKPHIIHRVIQNLLVPYCFADTHVYCDLYNLGYLHDASVGKLRFKRSCNFLTVKLSKSCHFAAVPECATRASCYSL